MFRLTRYGWACSAAGSALHSHCRGREFESPQVHQIKKTAKGGLFYLVWYSHEEIRRIKCGADERRWRGLDRAKPFFSPAYGRKSKRISSGPPRKKSLLPTRQKGLFSMISVPCGTGVYLRYDIALRAMIYAFAYEGTDIISCLRSKYIIRLAVYHIAQAIYH